MTLNKVLKNISLKELRREALPFKKKLIPFKNHALVICLSGNLGSGKTTFVQELAKIFKIKEKIISPTFILMRIYKIKDKYFDHFIHIDAYRLKSKDELEKLGWQEILKNKRNLIFIEWPKIVSKILPKERINIYFKHTSSPLKRTIRFSFPNNYGR